MSGRKRTGSHSPRPSAVLHFVQARAWRRVARGIVQSMFAGLAAGSALAQSAAPLALEPQVVTASRTAQPADDTLPSTTVITREEIENSQETDVAALLRREAGVEIAQSGGLGSQTSIFMRGTNSNQTLVLLDGVRLNALESGGAPIQNILLSEVDHIEIVRGNVSALYGSQAVGGVIQIFTRAAGAASGVTLDAQGGNLGTRNVALAAATVIGPGDAQTHAALTASYHTAGGFSAIDPSEAPYANPNDNGYENTSLSGRLSQNLGPFEVGIRFYQSQGRLSFDDATNYSFDVPTYDGRIQTNQERSRVETGTAFARADLASFWHSELQLATSRDHTSDTSSFPDSFDIGTTDSRIGDYTWNNTFQVAASQKVTAGIEHLDETGTSSAYGSEFTRRVDSGFAGYLADFGPNQVQLNARADHYSDFGGAQSGLVGYGYRLTDTVKLVAQAATAFDAPTFDDLYYPGASNPDLRPEKSRSVDIGAAYAAGGSDARIDVFRDNVRDLIAFDSASFIPENIDQARITGVELSGRTRWHQWQAYANATFQRAIDSQTDELLLRRATRLFNAGIAYEEGAWRGALDFQSSGPRFDSDINTFARTQVAGYGVINLVGRYRLAPHTTLSLSLLNAADRHYQLVDGYETAPRAVLVGLSTSL